LLISGKNAIVAARKKYNVCNMLHHQEDYMLRQVMVPSEGNSTISIPVEFFGTEVEILVFPSDKTKVDQNNDSIDGIFDKHLFSLANYKFDRDEANDYE
jgi:hypothetical protein